jgi:nitric oxide synthase oxygenase domain/subunit
MSSPTPAAASARRYADTEIVRNLTDASRYNLSSEIASKALGLDTKSDSSMWRDRAIVELDVAVMHSFREAGMGMCCIPVVLSHCYCYCTKIAVDNIAAMISVEAAQLAT